MHITNLLVCAIVLLILYIYRLFKNTYSYFEQNGIPYVKPTLIFGNVKDWILMRRALPVIHYDIYKQLEPHKFGGVFSTWKKTILIRDPDLIRHILVKDFVHFYDRNKKPDHHIDKLSQHLFLMTGQEWKNLRIKLTSTFTSGKMKMMFPLVKKCGEKLGEKIENASNDDELDIKDVCGRFTTDVIGSCAFGIEINSLDNPDSEFRKMGKEVFQVKFRTIIRSLFPQAVRYFKSMFTNESLYKFFSGIVQKTVKYREEQKVTRGDFLDLLIALKNDTDSHKVTDKQEEADLGKFLTQLGEKRSKSNIEMTSDLMTAQCFLFFLAGFETSSSTLNYMMLELAQNQHIQDKLRNEINTVLENNNNELTYDVLKQMKYLDMVMAETLRKYPITGNLTRICTETYKIPDSKVVIERGTTVIISILGIHHDEKYYEKPHEFYPEHFTEEAIAKRPHYIYLPFGEGPRVCIGERFAKMQVKVAAINLLKNFSYQLSPKVKIPVEFAPGIGLFDIKGGNILKCRKI